jgi:hypothetical protein
MSGIDVSGGVGGTAVALDALEAAGAHLLREGVLLVEVLEHVAAAAVTSDLADSHVVSPHTAVAVEAAVMAALGPSGLAGDLARLEGLGGAVLSAVWGYRAADAAAAAGVAAAQDLIMGAVGRQAPALLVGVLTLDALGVDVAAVLDHAAYDRPHLADLAGGTEGLLGGLAQSPVTAPLLVPGLLARGWEEPGLDEAGVDRDEAAVRVLADSVAVWGLLRERGPAVVRAEPTARPGARAPVDLASLTTDQLNLSDGEDYPGHVRVVEVPQDEGALWILEVAGTQEWDPRAGASPFDVTTDVRLMGEESTVLAQGAAAALAQAQAASGRDVSREGVLLVGHSLGGIVAAGLASSPRFREAHGPVSVVTMGSPVGRMPIPASVPVLSLEHAQDAVPRLDGTPNPDRARWTTVTRDLRGDLDGVDTASGAHATGEYVETAAAADVSDERSLVAWRAEHRAFFEPAEGREAVVRDYRVERSRP